MLAPDAASRRNRPASKAPWGSASSGSRTFVTRCPRRPPSRSRFPSRTERDRERPAPAHPWPGGGPDPARARRLRRYRRRRRRRVHRAKARPRANSDADPTAGHRRASTKAPPPAEPRVLTADSSRVSLAAAKPFQLDRDVKSPAVNTTSPAVKCTMSPARRDHPTSELPRADSPQGAEEDVDGASRERVCECRSRAVRDGDPEEARKEVKQRASR